MIPIYIKFIGNIGVGKTTAICKLLNLIKEGEPILDTAQGRTTACDVHIWFRNNLPSSILVDQYDNNEFDKILRKFIEKPFEISSELQTIIKNILNPDDEENKSYFEEIKIKFQNKEELILFCKKKAKYNERKEFCIANIGNTKLDDFSWIKDNFNKINTGKNPSFGIPKNITININSINIKNYNEWFNNKCFIDTKGIENLNYQNNSKFVQKEVYCSSFCYGPERSIKNQIQKSNIGIDNKFILILPKYDEPEHVNGAEGCYNTGILIKVGEFMQSTNGIINGQNILVFDSRRPRPLEVIEKFITNF